MDLYTEYLVTRKKTVIDYIIMALIVISALCATVFLIPSLFAQTYGMFVFLLVAGVWYLAYYIVMSRHIEYEYCVTEGSMDVDMITGKKKRKKITEISLRNAEIIAPTTVEYSDQFSDSSILVKVDTSKNDNEVMDFFIVYPGKDGKKTRLIFTPNQKVLDMIKKYNPNKTFFE